jgi:hypothetical protein
MALVIAIRKRARPLDVAGAPLEHKPKQISICKLLSSSTPIEIARFVPLAAMNVRGYNRNANGSI